MSGLDSQVNGQSDFLFAQSSGLGNLMGGSCGLINLKYLRFKDLTNK